MSLSKRFLLTILMVLLAAFHVAKSSAMPVPDLMERLVNELFSQWLSGKTVDKRVIRSVVTPNDSDYRPLVLRMGVETVIDLATAQLSERQSERIAEEGERQAQHAGNLQKALVVSFSDGDPVPEFDYNALCLSWGVVPGQYDPAGLYLAEIMHLRNRHFRDSSKTRADKRAALRLKTPQSRPLTPARRSRMMSLAVNTVPMLQVESTSETVPAVMSATPVTIVSPGTVNISSASQFSKLLPPVLQAFPGFKKPLFFWKITDSQALGYSDYLVSFLKKSEQFSSVAEDGACLFSVTDFKASVDRVLVSAEKYSLIRSRVGVSKLQESLDKILSGADPRNECLLHYQFKDLCDSPEAPECLWLFLVKSKERWFVASPFMGVRPLPSYDELASAFPDAKSNGLGALVVTFLGQCMTVIENMYVPNEEITGHNFSGFALERILVFEPWQRKGSPVATAVSSSSARYVDCMPVTQKTVFGVPVTAVAAESVHEHPSALSHQSHQASPVIKSTPECKRADGMMGEFVRFGDQDFFESVLTDDFKREYPMFMNRLIEFTDMAGLEAGYSGLLDELEAALESLTEVEVSHADLTFNPGKLLASVRRIKDGTPSTVDMSDKKRFVSREMVERCLQNPFLTGTPEHPECVVALRREDRARDDEVAEGTFFVIFYCEERWFIACNCFGFREMPSASAVSAILAGGEITHPEVLMAFIKELIRVIENTHVPYDDGYQLKLVMRAATVYKDREIQRPVP
ncbi:hypothetical protein [Spongorhabdus nitratireducens]